MPIDFPPSMVGSPDRPFLVGIFRDEKMLQRGRISCPHIFPVGTSYIAYDGDRVTDPSRGAWIPRGFGPVIVQGLAVGGSTAVFIDQSADGATVLESTSDLAPQLSAGAVVDVHLPYWRCRVVQSGANADSALIMLTQTEKRPGLARYTSTTSIPVGTQYMTSSGGWTTNAGDGSTWLPRLHRAVLVQGVTVGGSTAVTLEGANRGPQSGADQRGTVLYSRTIGNLPAGEEVDLGAVEFVRLKVVQSTAPTTAQLLTVTT